ncbi:C2H2-like zinc finger protein isoform 1 [Hibiscus syriacus]|uniref:C2H2-like zinc finger protein isoform 1 n=1 Tax=Hibiscus syriacus TaxID=106335 RepID=A0A6A2YTU1_HIBSY|nr:C2H2-like zinc finger protein isoform 1 [Hibiscus syriacus]
MPEWTIVAVAAVAVGILLILLVVFIRRWCYRKDIDDNRAVGTENFQDGIARLNQASLHHHHQIDLDSKRRGNYYVFRRGVSAKPLFNWADHPSLITDAVENGWSRFGFTNYMSSPSTRSSLLGLCAAGDFGRGNDVEVNWEVCLGSADFMQKIRLNSGSKKGSLGHHSMEAASVIRTALPLPGPPLGNSAFPQEAYFEITILYCRGDDHDSSPSGKLREGEKIKLIKENSNPKASSESLVHVIGNHDINTIEELKLAIRDDGKGKTVMLSVGLTAGGSLPLKLLGSYPGSIGFNSDGSVYLDGIKLVFESEKEEWGKTEKVIGCGFDPRQKKVFFTLDSELVRVINCKSEEFGTPLYPTLAANDDVSVLVNFGQSAFAYTPANGKRTPNPCFIGPLVNSPAAALGYEDSKELFSMGRIDSQWLNRCTTKGSHNNGSNYPMVDFDEESEADLFEIILDDNGRSPNSVL